MNKAEVIDNVRFDDEADWTSVPHMFGTQKNRGNVIFLDAYPEDIPALHMDIMNPHYSPYYSEGKPPADHHNPTPIKFLTVAKGTKFIFRAVAKKEQNLPQKIRVAFAEALTKEGVGAKIALGYGRFVIDEDGQKVLLKKRKQRHEEKKRRLSPWLDYIELINQVGDWGQFKQIVLDNEKLVEYRKEMDVTEAVRIKALEIRNKWRKSWGASRDEQIATWLQPAGVEWPCIVAGIENPVKEKSADYEKIMQLIDWGAYKSAGIDLSKLPLDALQLLKQKMEEWGCYSKKAKEDKKTAFKKVKDLLRQHQK